MGNCLGLSSDEPKPNAINPTYSSGTSAPTSTNRGFSESSNSGANRRFSETSSSGATNRRSSESSHSHFSSAVSGSIRSIDERDPNGEILETPNLKIFTFAELKTATKGFKPISVLGEGGFGMVYKGWIDDKPTSTGSKTVVAVKKLNSESVQGFEQWQSEVNFLGSLSHPNLVRLLGYCWEDKELLLVYEYMPKGSLENHLFKRCVEPISWDRRLSIALGAARGLAFLHNLGRQIIYRDFKASNILLDGDYNAKLSDFGLAKFGPSGENSHVTTRIMGTYGYAAPEYVATGHLYVKSDVYGFGVVLLEILTGLRAIDPRRPNGQQNLMQWTRKSLSSKKKLSTIMDPRIRGQYLFKAAVETAQLTEKCLRFDPRTRPSMNEVVDALQQIIAMKDQSKETRKTLSVNSKKSEAGSHRQGPVRKAFKSF